jgi:hypothetical protein
MEFTVDEKTFAITAFEIAIASENDLIGCHEHCHSAEDDDLRDRCSKNVEAFKKLRKRFERARRYTDGF